MTEPEFDVVIVGGGIAGLAAAWRLRDRNVLLLESAERVGGRVRSIQRGRYWANLGAHLLNPGDSLTGDLCREFEIPTVLPTGSVTAVAMGGRVMRGGRPETWPFRLSMSPAARLSLIRVGLRLRRALWRSQRANRAGVFAAAPASLDHLPLDPALDRQTFAELIGPAHPQVRALLRVAANRAAGELETLSAQYGVDSSLGAVAAKRANVIGGTERLVDAIAERLGSRVRVSSEVAAVRAVDGRVEVRVDGMPDAIRARTAIVAVPAPIARRIVKGLPTAKVAALDQVTYAPWVVAAIFTRETRAMPWDDLYAVAVPARTIAMAFNPANALRTSGARLPGGVLVTYAAADRAGELLDQPDERIRAMFLADLEPAFPGLGSLVDEVVIQRWPFGGPVGAPGRIARQPHLAAPFGRVAFAGDYLLYPGLDNAIRSADAAVEHVRRVLDSS